MVEVFFRLSAIEFDALLKQLKLRTHRLRNEVQHIANRVALLQLDSSSKAKEEASKLTLEKTEIEADISQLDWLRDKLRVSAQRVTPYLEPVEPELTIQQPTTPPPSSSE